MPPVKVGLGVFLAVATSLFALLISAYHMRMMGQDWTTLPDSAGALAEHGPADPEQRRHAVDAWCRTTRDSGRRESGLIAAGVFLFPFLPVS